uniref:Uncharacterized protein n=1 Tax=Physcomitrium patens TaxID=3218 RepID=A0A2K1KH37_PHYPA|nr:hypothetical protein PHYPA_009471 [Physcomitrium patens]
MKTRPRRRSLLLAGSSFTDFCCEFRVRTAAVPVPRFVKWVTAVKNSFFFHMWVRSVRSQKAMEPEPTVSTVVAVVAVIVCEHFGVRCNAVCTQQEIAETSHDANLHDGLVRTVKHRTFWRLRRVSFHGLACFRLHVL